MTECQHGVKQQLHNIFLLFSLTCPAIQAPKPLYQSTGRGKQPVTWTTLIEVLHHIELFNLAGNIRTSKCPSEQWNGCMEIQHLYVLSCAWCLSCVPYQHISVSFCVYKSLKFYKHLLFVRSLSTSFC